MTGEYHGQPRFGGKMDLSGFEAYMMGSGYLCLALLIFSAMLIETQISKKLILTLSIFFLVGAIASFINAF